MGYQRSDNRFGEDRWRDRDEGGRGSGTDRDYGRGDYGRGGDDDRGFMDRAGDEVRSWFGDDEAERRREMDQRRWEREQRMSGGRDNDWDRGGYGCQSHMGGWGNQSGESWNRDRPGERGWGDNERDRDRGGSESDYGTSRGESWGGSGFGGDYNRGRRFDRVDSGSTGTHGAHPMSAPAGGLYGAGYGTSSSGYGSSARTAAIIQNEGRQQGGQGGGRGSDLHDRHYSQWRNRQIEELDRDYDEYRREHQSKFEEDFGGWRTRRQGQRRSMSKVGEQMEVVGSDGQHVGTVDKVRGDRLILTKSDENAGGRHHSIPCSWIESVEDRVTINKSADEARNAWRDEEDNRALFEGDENRQGEGAHILNRSFSGTY